MRLMMNCLFVAAVLLLTACAGPDRAEVTPAPTLASKAESLLRIAKATEEAGDAAAALDLYRQVVHLSPESVDAWLGQARTHRVLGEKDGEIAALEQALDQNSGNAEVLRWLANTLIDAGSPDQALEHLELAEEQGASDARLSNSRGVALDMLGRHEEAQDSFREALALETGRKGYIENNLAMSYLLAEDYDQAVALLSRLLETRGEDARLRQNLAMAYGLKGDHDKALALGLKDLSAEAATENIEFYKAYSKKLNQFSPSAGALQGEQGTSLSAIPLAQEIPDKGAVLQDEEGMDGGKFIVKIE